MISGIEHSLGATESELWSEEFSSFPGDMTETRHIQRQSLLCFVAKSPADTDEMTESRRAAKRAETSDEERVCTCLLACWRGWCVNGMTKFIFWQKQFVKSTEAVSEGFQKRWIIEPHFWRTVALLYDQAVGDWQGWKDVETHQLTRMLNWDELAGCCAAVWPEDDSIFGFALFYFSWQAATFDVKFQAFRMCGVSMSQMESLKQDRSQRTWHYDLPKLISESWDTQII